MLLNLAHFTQNGQKTLRFGIETRIFVRNAHQRCRKDNGRNSNFDFGNFNIVSNRFAKEMCAIDKQWRVCSNWHLIELTSNWSNLCSKYLRWKQIPWWNLNNSNFSNMQFYQNQFLALKSNTFQIPTSESGENNANLWYKRKCTLKYVSCFFPFTGHSLQLFLFYGSQKQLFRPTNSDLKR